MPHRRNTRGAKGRPQRRVIPFVRAWRQEEYNPGSLAVQQTTERAPLGDFHLAGWLVQPTLGRISRAGRSVHLRPKLMDVLVTLARHAGSVVSKDALLQAVWPDQFLEESALTRAVADLRQALGDEAHEPRVIETIPKRGYRLMVPVSWADAGSAQQVAPQRPVSQRPQEVAEAAEPEPLPVLVGRERELTALAAWLEAARAGAGRVALVAGESGTGKTALLAEFAARALRSNANLLVAVGRAQVPAGAGDVYRPFREILGQLTGDMDAGWLTGGIPGAHAQRLRDASARTAAAILERGPDLVETFISGASLTARLDRLAGDDAAPWLPELRRLAARQALRPLELVPRQADLFDQFARVLGAVAGEHAPLVLVLDDLQWADEGTARLLFHLGREAARQPILVLAAFRPHDLEAPAGSRHPLEALLDEITGRYGGCRLDLPETNDQAFVSALVDTEPNRLGRTFRRLLWQRTGGHPLFTVELLRAFREAGALERDESGRWVAAGEADWATVPARAEGLLGARMARVPSGVRRLLDIASVEGEEFTAEAVARVAGADERETALIISRELGRVHGLVNAVATRWRHQSRLSIYRFRHGAFRQHLCDRLDPVEKGYLHHEVARALEAIYGPSSAEHAPALSWQFEQAGVAAKAAEYARIAGLTAMRQAAAADAAAWLSKALDLLMALPEDERPPALEVDVRLDLAPAVFAGATEGSRLEALLLPVPALCARVPDPLSAFRAHLTLAVIDIVRGRYETAERSGRAAREMAASIGAAPLAAVARSIEAMVELRRGEFAKAREGLLSPLTRESGVPPGVTILGTDPEVWRLGWLGYTTWFIGSLDEAVRHADAAVAAAERAADPFSVASGRGIRATIFLHAGYGELAELDVQEALRIVAERGYQFGALALQFFQGWLLVERGRVGEGRALLTGIVREARSRGLAMDMTKLLARLADAHLKAGATEDGLSAVSEGLALAEAGGERFYEAELLRVKGDLLRTSGASEQAVAAYRRAIDVAARQGAVAWETRARACLETVVPAGPCVR
jgi:DNA-binding winged helix-turn-helix (wHTH) protein/tetratricopeptide (TPR) repeat protein